MKFKPRSRVTALAIVGTATVALTGLAFAAPNHAVADPTVTYVTVGSDTTENVMDQLGSDLAGNDLGSYDAVNPVTQAIGEIITPAKATSPVVNCSFTRPDGSTQGLNALRKSINPNTTAAQLAAPPQPNCVDFSRSSSGPGSNAATTGALVYIPFAEDAVAVATGPTSGTGATKITTADMFTKADLISLFTNCTTVTEGGITYNPGTAATGQQQIDLYVPQAGSGTLSFWASTLGFSATNLPACDHQTIVGTSPAQAVEENDGTAVATDPNGIMPFSVAQWIAQRNGHSDRRHGAVEHNLNGVSPFVGTAATGSLNTAFPINREVYNVALFSRVSGSTADPGLVSMLVGPNSFLCQDSFTITGFGFGLLGSGTTDTCGSIANSLRAFDPTTNPV